MPSSGSSTRNHAKLLLLKATTVVAALLRHDVGSTGAPSHRGDGIALRGTLPTGGRRERLPRLPRSHSRWVQWWKKKQKRNPIMSQGACLPWLRIRPSPG